MAITYQKERWEAFYPDFLPLWEGIHLAESRAPETADYTAFNYLGYQQLAEQGLLHVQTVRVDGRLIGYGVSLIVPHINQSECRCAMTPLYFLHPRYRGQGIGGKLLRAMETDLKAQGAMMMFIGAKTHLPYQAIFAHLGFHPVEMTMLKDIRS